MILSPCVFSVFSLAFGAQETIGTQNAQNKMNRNAPHNLRPIGFCVFCDFCVRLFISFIDFIQAIFTQAVAVMFFQISFCGVVESYLHAPAVDGMDAFKRFSAAGTGLGHRQKKRGAFQGRPRKKNINYLNNIALGNMSALNELSSTPSAV